MIENENAAQAAEEEISVEIVEDPPEGQEAGSANDGDELERYTKSVSKRINKLNQKTKQAEDRAEYLEQLAMQKDQELNAYRQHSVVQQNIQKEKLRVAKSRQSQSVQQATAPQQENYQSYPSQQPQQQVQQEEIKPTNEALSWHDQNQWYGDSENEENLQATQFAYFTHFNLMNEGFEPDSEEYYNELDTRVFRIYPDLRTEPKAGEKEERPNVQRVASASPAGRQQSRSNKRGVKFTNSELQRLRGLKPHNMTEEAWLKRVASEKQKIAQREAR